MSNGSKSELERWAGELGLEESHLTLLILGVLAGLGGWWLLTHAHIRLVVLRPALGFGIRVLLVLALLGLLCALAALLVRELATRRTARSRTWVVPLVSPGFDPPEAAIAAFVIQVYALRRRWLHWLDAPATAFRVLMTGDAQGRPVYLWQLPRRHLRSLRRAAESSFPGLRLEDANHLLPPAGRGPRVRLELKPARRDEWPFRRIPAGLDPKSSFAHALGQAEPGTRQLVAIDLQPVPPRRWRNWLRQTLKRAKDEQQAEHLPRDRDPLNPAERIERQLEQRALWRKIDNHGSRDPLFYLQVLVEAQAPRREEAKLALENLWAGFEQWHSDNFLSAAGYRTGGADAPWHSPWFDYRMDSGRISSDRVVAGWEMAPALIPWTKHCTSLAVVRLEPEQSQPPAEAIGAQGIGVSILSDGRRVGLTPNDVRYHVHLIAPTGGGKSTLMGNAVLDWIDLGLPTVLIDPGKADTTPYVLSRMRRRHWDRVVLIDPSERERSVGINVLEAARDPNLHQEVADHVVGIFGQLYGQYWGPRGATMMRQALLTLLRLPEPALGDLLPLLTDEHVRDNWITDPADRRLWSDYKPEDVDSLIWKLKDVLSLRPAVRNIVCQRRSTVDLGQLLNGDGILLIRLPARIGEDTCSLLGRLLVARVWQTLLERSAVPEERRRFLLAAIDEFETMVQLSTTWERFLEQARGLRAGLMLGHQHWRQLPDEVRHTVGANALTKLAMRLEHDDAAAMAPMVRPLTSSDLTGLERYHVAARLCLAGAVQSAYTGPMPPPRPALSDGQELASRALERYGRPRAEIEAELNAKPRRRRGQGRREEALDWDD